MIFFRFLIPCRDSINSFLYKIVPVRQADRILLKRAFVYLKPYKGTFILAFLCLLLSLGFLLLEPWLTAKIVTSVFSKNVTRLLKIISILGAVSVCSALIGWLQSSLYVRLNEKIVFDIKKDMFQKIVNLPTKAFDDIRIGEFISRLNGDAGAIANIITQQFVNLIIDILKVVVIGVIIFKISSRLSLAVTACLSLSYFIFLISGKILRKQNEVIAKLRDSYFSNVQETVAGIREVKSMGMQQRRIKSFLSLGSELMRKNITVGILSSGASGASQITGVAAQITMLTYGFFLILRKVISVEQYIAYLYYMMQFFSSLMNITRLNSSIQQVMVSLKRIFDLMDSFTYSPIIFGSLDIPEVGGRITFDSVHFSYNADREVLKGISFSIVPGITTAIVGRSGGGKTTIFNLLLRLYNPTSGKILIDSVDIADISEKTLRKTISVVRQEPFLFRMSIRDNLLTASPEATESELVNACQTACIHDDIINTFGGYDTQIGEHGINLSIGQKQRLAIARAVLRNTPIILFDEATSALDNLSQSHIKKAIKNLSGNRTILIIAHRLSTIIDADSIIVLNNGVIDGMGKQSELYTFNTVFRDLYECEIPARESQTRANEDPVAGTKDFSIS